MQLLRILIALILIGMASAWAAIDSTGRKKTTLEDRYGSISPGVQANLVILDENPLEDISHFESPYMVIMNGRVVFKRSN